MDEVSPSTRIKILKQLDPAINNEFGMNFTEELVGELVDHLEKQEKTMTQEEISKILNSSKLNHYKKFGKVIMRLGVTGESITTKIKGETETTNTVKKGDYIVKGSQGEFYIISSTKAETRYRHIFGEPTYVNWGIYEAIGECWGREWVGDSLQFVASWGEEMILHKEDYLVSSVVSGRSDVYRIEKSAFCATYREVTE